MGLLVKFDRRSPGLWDSVKANLLSPWVPDVQSTTQCSTNPEPLSALSLTKYHLEGPNLFLWAHCWCRCGELLLEVGLGDQKCSLLSCLRFLLSSQHGCSGLCSLTATYPSSFNIFAVLQFLKCLIWKAREQCVSIIQLRCSESMNDSLVPS